MPRKVTAMSASLGWHTGLILLLSLAAAPAPCANDCDHVGSGSIKGFDLDWTHGAVADLRTPRFASDAVADPSFDATPYVLPPRPVGQGCYNGCARAALSRSERSCPDRWIGAAPRVIVAAKPDNVPTGTSEEPLSIVACILVTWSGRAAEAYLVRNEGLQVLNTRLPLAIRNEWLFEPARTNGEATDAWVRVRINPDIYIPSTYPDDRRLR